MILHRLVPVAAVLCAALSVLAAEPLVLDDWEGLTPDAALLHDGAPALAWPELGTNTTVTARNAPTDFTPYQTLSFHLHVAEPTDSVLTLILDSNNPDTPQADYYSLTLRTNFRGWRHVLVSRSMFNTSRSPLGWDRIQRVFLNSRWAHRLDPETVVHLTPLVFTETPIPGMEPAPGELLINRSFELAPAGGDVPSGWSAGTYNTQTKVSLDSEHAHSGQYAVRIDGAAGSNRGGVTRNIPPQDTDPESLYLMTAWVRTEGQSDASLGTSVRFTSVGPAGGVLRSDYRSCAPAPYDWRLHTWLVTLPETTRNFNLVLFHHGSGSAWWDDVSLRRFSRGQALTPALHAAVSEARPLFTWEAPADAKGQLIIESTAAEPPFRVAYSVQGNTFRIPDPLPQGNTYQWYVLHGVDTPDTLAAFATDGDMTFGEFYAGSWQERLGDQLGDLTAYRDLYTRLSTLAERNGMWDRFSLLGDFLAAVDALIESGTLPEGVSIDSLMETVDELALRTPWWERVFLDDQGLFADLKLDLPGLEGVRAAVESGNFPQARERLLQYYRERKNPSYYRKWEQRPPQNPARTVDAGAERILTHKMPIHSYDTPTYDLTREFNWHVFPIVDVEWPTRIHRHQHWSTLAGAYWATGNDMYAQEIALQLLDWAQDNPLERWDRHRYRWAWSTLNATVRIYGSWINGWLRIRNSPAWNADAHSTMLALLREHGRFLMTRKATTGNWVVAEARGLVELGIMFPEFQEAEAWRNEGFRRLQREIDIQVLPDGMHVERTPGYHSMTLSCFLEPIKLALLNNVEVENRDHFLAKLESMYELYLYGSRPDRRMAQIGDGGNMSAIPLLRRGWDMFGREDMIYVATNGENGVPPVKRSYAFAAGGFYVSRSDWLDPQALWSIMDWGGFVGHCHDDMGQICLYAYGAPLLIDSGRFSYAWPLRQYFRDTVGHNTVMVNSTSQKRRDPLDCTWISNPQFDLTRGLTDNSEPLLHERTLVFKQPGSDGPGYWVVLDRLEGSGTHRLDQRWHISEKLAGQVDGSNVICSAKPDASESLPSLTLAGLPQDALRTAIDPGWVSYAWYKKEPVDVAQFTLETAVPAVFVTVLYPTPAGVEPARVTVRAVPARIDGREAARTEATAFAVSISRDGHTEQDLWVLRHTDTGVVETQDVQLDGRLARLRLDGTHSAWLAAQASRLSAGGRELFAAPHTLDAVSRLGDAFSVSDCPAITIAADTPCRVNDGAPVAPQNGLLALSNVSAPAVPPPPKSRQEVNIDIAPPPDVIPPTGFAILLPPQTPLPDSAIRVNAAAYVNQEGGAVEVTTNKVGARGEAFLHWDHAGHWLEYDLTVPTAGTYHLLLRACTAEGATLRRISVNGTTPEAGTAQEIVGTGGYSSTQDDWRLLLAADTTGRPLTLELPPGNARIRLENLDGRSLNLNWVALVPAADVVLPTQ